MMRRFHPVTVQQATEESPTLAGLLARAREANAMLHTVQDLIPPDMRGAVQSGPLDGDQWCLLVQGSAAAAKLRQLLPALQMRLRAAGREVAAIRIKVQARR